MSSKVVVGLTELNDGITNVIARIVIGVTELPLESGRQNNIKDVVLPWQTYFFYRTAGWGCSYTKDGLDTRPTNT